MSGTLLGAGAKFDPATTRLKSIAELSLVILCSLVCGLTVLAVAADPVTNPRFLIKALPLPNAHGIVSLDYFIYDQARGRMWVPASNTGKLDVIDILTDRITAVGGFPTATVNFAGKRPIMG